MALCTTLDAIGQLSNSQVRIAIRIVYSIAPGVIWELVRMSEGRIARECKGYGLIYATVDVTETRILQEAQNYHASRHRETVTSECAGCSSTRGSNSGLAISVITTHPTSLYCWNGLIML